MDPRARPGGATGEQIALRPIRDREVASTSRDRPKLQAVHTFSTETSGIGTSVVSSFDRSFDLEHNQDVDGMDDPHKRMAINYDADGSRYAAYADSGPHSNTGRGFDRMYQQSASRSQNGDGPSKLNVSNGKGEPMEYQEWDRKRRNSKSPNPSPNTSRRGSFRGDKKEKHFLGAPGSAWVNWSKDRRNSFRRRVEMIEQKEKEAEKTRVSTPVKKARQECVRFVSREMEDQYIAEANEPVRKKPAKKEKKKEKKKRGQKTDDPLKKIKLTDVQWNLMMDYWENPIFVRSRYVGIVMSLLALAICVYSLATTTWSTYDVPAPMNFTEKWNGSTEMGLWRVCGQKNNTETGELEPYSCWRETRFGWQNGIIGLLLFSAGVGFLATILSICGLCVNNLPKKLYYYHSAGEIFFVCALICTTGLVAYPVCIETFKLINHKYGYAYMIGWGASAGYFAAALCMMLDDLIQTSATGCCKKKKQSLQHV
ncbi:uncharacterized protein LOC135496627 isoform X2 [Lineus longissimus]|uniref:uncharacterized protein LOC135496627 isoform X2 n=1 Tax=Lineus longissimus TaxID=88925 RepID=UPI002B4CA272